MDVYTTFIFIWRYFLATESTGIIRELETAWKDSDRKLKFNSKRNELKSNFYWLCVLGWNGKFFLASQTHTQKSISEMRRGKKLKFKEYIDSRRVRSSTGIGRNDEKLIKRSALWASKGMRLIFFDRFPINNCFDARARKKSLLSA